MQQYGAAALGCSLRGAGGDGVAVAAEAVCTNAASYCMVWQLGFFESIAEQVLYHSSIQECLTDKSQRHKNFLYRNDKLV